MKHKKRVAENKWIKSVVNNVLYPVLALGIIIAVWAIVSKALQKPLLLPMPDVVFSRFFSLFSEETFWSSVFSTILRTAIAFAISFVLGYFTAILAVRFSPVSKLFDTFVAVLRAAPTVAVILITYAFFHTRTMTVIVGFLIAYPIFYSSFLGVLRGADKNLVSMATVYKISRPRAIFHTYFLSISPFVFDISKSTLSLTLKVVISAEILTLVSKSVGGAIYSANSTFEASYLLAWTTMAIAMSFLVELIVEVVKKCVVRWEK